MAEKYLGILTAIIDSSEPLNQAKLPKLVNCSERTVIRAIKVLSSRNLIKYVRGGVTESQGRPPNTWRIGFLGALMKFLDSDSESQDKLARMFEREWIIFHEWDYIKANQIVLLYVMAVISKFALENRLRPDWLLEDISSINQTEKKTGKAYSKLNANPRELTRIEDEIDKEIKNQLLRSILGLNKLFCSEYGEDGCYETENVIPYLVKNPVFKGLYDSELERLRLNFNQLESVSKVIADPGRAPEIAGWLFNSKIEEENKYILSLY